MWFAIVVLASLWVAIVMLALAFVSIADDDEAMLRYKAERAAFERMFE